MLSIIIIIIRQQTLYRQRPFFNINIIVVVYYTRQTSHVASALQMLTLTFSGPVCHPYGLSLPERSVLTHSQWWEVLCIIKIVSDNLLNAIILLLNRPNIKVITNGCIEYCINGCIILDEHVVVLMDTQVTKWTYIKQS